MSTYLYPPTKVSDGCKLLSEAMHIRRIRRDQGSNFHGDRSRVVINWGNAHVSDEVLKCRMINNPHAVSMASDKRRCFLTLDGIVPIPDYTDDVGAAEKFLEDGGDVVVRETLTGHGGLGIHIVHNLDELHEYEEAPLFTKYIKKKSEYRAHVFSGGITIVDKKLRKLDFPDHEVNWKIRNLENGFIYSRHFNHDEVPGQVTVIAKLAVERLGLDFGAVDVIYNSKDDMAYVLEVNTAPGLAGEMVQNYVFGLSQIIDAL